MPARLLRTLLLAAAAANLSAALAAPRVGAAEVDAALLRAKVPATAMVALVQEVGGSRPRLAWQADRPVNPASLTKLVTTFAALELLGPAWRWTTPVWLDGKVADGVLDGNLVIKGSGDPTLVLERLWLLLRRVRQAGVREIRGDIVIDRSAFALPAQDPADFDGEPLRPYNVRADALLLNYGSMLLTFTPDPASGSARVTAEPPLAGVRIDPTLPLSPAACGDWQHDLQADFTDTAHLRFDGSFALACGAKQWATAYPDPARYDARVLGGLWAEIGGTLTGTVRDGIAPLAPPTFEVRSPALAEIVRDINKFSNNVMAQQLFLTLGLDRHGIGSPETARLVLHGWLESQFGSAADAVAIDNGSGLSRDTRISANGFGQLLQAAWASPVMAELMSSLPIAGIDGTLRHARSAVGRAHLKTGSLRDVAGVAGYVLGNSGRRYVVVGIVNDPDADAARPALDALVRWAANEGQPAAPSLGR